MPLDVDIINQKTWGGWANFHELDELPTFHRLASKETSINPAVYVVQLVIYQIVNFMNLSG